MDFLSWIKYIFLTLCEVLSIFIGAVTFYGISTGDIEKTTVIIILNIVSLIFSVVMCVHWTLNYPMDVWGLLLNKSCWYTHTGIKIPLTNIVSFIRILVSLFLYFIGIKIHLGVFLGILLTYIIAKGPIEGIIHFFRAMISIILRIVVPLIILSGIVIFVIFNTKK